MNDERKHEGKNSFPVAPSLGVLALLALLGLLYFGELVLHPSQILYAEHSDFLTLHLPSKVFLVRSWQETGEVPLWNPYSFSGLPFLHDTQVSAFYPPHGPLYLLPVDRLGSALSWVIVLHVIAAGWSMYGYARSQGLGRGPAFLAGLGFMFAGKWLVHVLQVGHYNMLPLAWLPLLLWCLEGAIRRGSLGWATGAGGVFAWFILGAYPYVTLYAGLFTALWTLAPALERAGYLGASGPRSVRRTMYALGLWAGLGAWTATVGIALGAVQLLPSLEAAPHATRSLGVAASWDMLRGGLESLVTLTGRGVIGTPAGAAPASTPQAWDYEGGLGAPWLVLAVLAPLLLHGRPRFHAAVALLILLYALGGAVFLQDLPGFRLFRLPSRSLLLLPLPVSLLAARTVQMILEAPAPLVSCRIVFLKIMAAIVFLQGGYAALRWLQHFPIHLHLYWLVLPFSVLAASGLLGLTPSRLAFCGWACLLLVDLWTLTGRLAVVKPWEDIYTPSPCVADLVRRSNADADRILTRSPPQSYSARSPLWPGLSEILKLEAVGGFNPTDLRRYKEYLQLITDVDEPLRPPQGNFTYPVLENFPIKNKPLLDLLRVRYLLQPVWQEAEAGVPYAYGDETAVSADPRWRKAAEDAAPRAFDFMGGGLVDLPPYALYENRAAFPRAFVVHETQSLPDRPELRKALQDADFRRTVLLEEVTPQRHPAAKHRHATVTRDLPNRVVIDVEAGEAGFLVLTDLWFPGWTCTIDGIPTTVLRANYLFRAVELPASARTIAFAFTPMSYARGKLISQAALALLALALPAWILVRGTRQKNQAAR